MHCGVIAEPQVDVATVLQPLSVFCLCIPHFLAVEKLTRVCCQDLRDMSRDGLGSAANRLVTTLLILGGRLYGSENNTRGDEVNMLRDFLGKTVLVCANMDVPSIDVIISAERSVEQRLELPRSRFEA